MFPKRHQRNLHKVTPVHANEHLQKGGGIKHENMGCSTNQRVNTNSSNSEHDIISQHVCPAQRCEQVVQNGDVRRSCHA